MERSSPRSSQPSLHDRVLKARGRLDSMDGTEDEYEIKKAALEHKIQTLQSEIAAQERVGYAEAQLHGRQQQKEGLDFAIHNGYPNLPTAGYAERPQSSNAALEHPIGLDPFVVDNYNEYGGHFASDGVLAGQRGIRTTPTWNAGSANTPRVTLDSPQNAPNSQPISYPGSSPEFGFFTPQKRQRTSLTHLNGPPSHSNKSLRTTPSPAATGSTSPTSYNSFEIPEEMFDFLGGNPKDTLRELREEQRLQERLAEERRERMRLDEEYARKLSEDLNDLSRPPSEHRVGPSSHARNTSQTVLDATGHYRRPSLSSPLLTPGPDPFATPLTSSRQELSFDGNPTFKSERTLHPSHSTSIPSEVGISPDGNPVKQRHTQRGTQSDHEFINLTNDSDLELIDDTAAFDQSSDTMELDPSIWQNSTHSGDAAQVQGNGYDSTNWALPGVSVGQNLYDTALGVYNTAQNYMGFGGSSVYGNVDTNPSYNAPFIDLSDDLSPSRWADNAFALHGINASDPANRQLYNQYMDRVDYVTNDPTRTVAEIKSLLENIRPDEDLPPENREGTPEAMTYPLMEHQKLGLAWLKKMEESDQKGGSESKRPPGFQMRLADPVN